MRGVFFALQIVVSSLTMNTMPSAATPRSRLPVRSLLVGAVVLVVAGAVFTMRQRTAAASGVALAQQNLAARAEMCSSRNITGTGVLMEVFSATGADAKPLASGLVPVLDVNTTPGSAVAPGQTVRWNGWIKAKSQGVHEFRLPPGVRGRLTISRILLVGEGAAPADSARIELTANRFYPFTLEVAVDAAALNAGTWLLSWVRPARGLEPVMRGSLFPPTELAQAAPAMEDSTHGKH